MKKKVKSKSKQSADAQLKALLTEAKKLGREIDLTNKDLLEKFNKIEAKINTSIDSLEKIYSDLDKIEKEAEEEIDKLMLGQAEDLAQTEGLREE